MAASTLHAAKSGLYADPRPDWLALRKEDVLDPDRLIADPHHHLWDRGGQRYLLDDITSDLASGHNVIATVYVEARSISHTPIFRRRKPNRNVSPRQERSGLRR